MRLIFSFEGLLFGCFSSLRGVIRLYSWTIRLFIFSHRKYSQLNYFSRKSLFTFTFVTSPPSDPVSPYQTIVMYFGVKDPPVINVWMGLEKREIHSNYVGGTNVRVGLLSSAPSDRVGSNICSKRPFARHTRNLWHTWTHPHVHIESVISDPRPRRGHFYPDLKSRGRAQEFFRVLARKHNK